MGKVPSINTIIPQDPTRVSISNVAPPDTSIYSTPVTTLQEKRTPVSSQSGMTPDGVISSPNASSVTP